MDKRTISNHSWICRTLNGTIALEEKTMPSKDRYFLKSVAKPIRVSDLYIILKEKYAEDYRLTSDFIDMINIMNKKLWISRVEKPQVIENDKKINDSTEEDTHYSRDSVSIPEDVMNLSRKLQNSLSEDVNPYPVHFENNKHDDFDKLDILKDEVDGYDDNGVVFIPDEQTKALIMKLGLNTVSDDVDDEALELPEENPFYQEADVPITKAAESVLKQLDAFKDFEYTHDDSTDSNEMEEIAESATLPETPVLVPVSSQSNVDVIASHDAAKEREEKRQERINKRTAQSPKKEPPKSAGLFGSLRDGLKKMIGK